MAWASAVRLSPSVEKQKLKLELLRGSRPKLESLPVSVVVHDTGNLAVISRFHHYQINERYDFFFIFRSASYTKLPFPLPW